jgi:L-fuculose-phosphate aldolase
MSDTNTLRELDEWAMRDAFCEVGRRVWQREYVASNDGNFSVRLNADRVLCTPTLVSKGFMKAEDMAVVNMDGQQIAGCLPMTSEVKAHLELYRQRADIRAVVHVHPPNATAFAVARQSLPKCVLPEVEVFLGEVPLVPYATPGTQDFADVLKPFIEHHNAFLLSSHGALTVGADPFECYYRMETVEQYCRILILSRQLGDWNQIDPAQVRDLLGIREKLGHRDRRILQNAPLCTKGVPGEACGQTPTTIADRALIDEIARRVLERLGRKP